MTRRGKWPRLALAIGLLLGVANLRGAGPAMFRDGERWVALGDSITHSGLYHSLVELYYATRFPELDLDVINSGIGGDRAPGGLRRLEWDVFAANPTVVSVMFGMNDVDRFLYEEGKTGAAIEADRRKAFQVYRDSQAAIVQRLQARGVRVILCTPTIFDDTAESPVPKLTGMNRALAGFAAAVEALASATGVSCVDFFGPMDRLNRAQQAENPAFTLVGADRIHPGPAGHLLMAYLFLKAQHAPALVSAVNIDAEKRHLIDVENGEASLLENSGAAGGVAFRWRARSLPFPVDAAAQVVRAWVPFDADLNEERLRVTGLAEGRYVIRIDGVDLRTWTAAELAAGVNLAGEAATPQQQQAAAVAKLLRERFETVAGQLRSIAMAEHLYGPRDGTPFTLEAMQPRLEQARESWKIKPVAQSIRIAVERYAERKPKQAGLEAKARRLSLEARERARPREHRYEIVRAP